MGRSGEFQPGLSKSGHDRKRESPQSWSGVLRNGFRTRHFRKSEAPSLYFQPPERERQTSGCGGFHFPPEQHDHTQGRCHYLNYALRNGPTGFPQCLLSGWCPGHLRLRECRRLHCLVSCTPLWCYPGPDGERCRPDIRRMGIPRDFLHGGG